MAGVGGRIEQDFHIARGDHTHVDLPNRASCQPEIDTSVSARWCFRFGVTGGNEVQKQCGGTQVATAARRQPPGAREVIEFFQPAATSRGSTAECGEPVHVQLFAAAITFPCSARLAVIRFESCRQKGRSAIDSQHRVLPRRCRYRLRPSSTPADWYCQLALVVAALGREL